MVHSFSIERVNTMTRQPILEKIFALDAGDIPRDLQDICLEIDDEFPLHYSNSIVQIEDDGNAFSEWLKTIGFIFNEDGHTSLAVWGT